MRTCLSEDDELASCHIMTSEARLRTRQRQELRSSSVTPLAPPPSPLMLRSQVSRGSSVTRDSRQRISDQISLQSERLSISRHRSPSGEHQSQDSGDCLTHSCSDPGSVQEVVLNYDARHYPRKVMSLYWIVNIYFSSDKPQREFPPCHRPHQPCPPGHRGHPPTHHHPPCTPQHWSNTHRISGRDPCHRQLRGSLSILRGNMSMLLISDDSRSGVLQSVLFHEF